ncbi:hypothetical protein OC835_006942 [Tilletia horrida]|nr:hypothetical protein OC835_006942 [Tilletia horrida]
MAELLHVHAQPIKTLDEVGFKVISFPLVILCTSCGTAIEAVQDKFQGHLNKSCHFDLRAHQLRIRDAFLELKDGLQFLPLSQLPAPLRCIPYLPTYPGFQCGHPGCGSLATTAAGLRSHKLGAGHPEAEHHPVRVQRWAAGPGVLWEAQAPQEPPKPDWAVLVDLQGQDGALQPPGRAQLAGPFFTLEGLRAARMAACQVVTELLQRINNGAEAHPEPFRTAQIQVQGPENLDASATLVATVFFGMVQLKRLKDYRHGVPAPLQLDFTHQFTGYTFPSEEEDIHFALTEAVLALAERNTKTAHVARVMDAVARSEIGTERALAVVRWLEEGLDETEAVLAAANLLWGLRALMWAALELNSPAAGPARIGAISVETEVGQTPLLREMAARMEVLRIKADNSDPRRKRRRI